ncbi:MAG: ABC transporter substrate-binding protein [Alteromonadaceae bacterium]|nr:ABC transporter substrate-binding protein [Alteromonadaceae bacterium]MBL4910519.1 ABC transporter substrate-binding protein [Alteromonadaceae bacterium]
MKYIKKMFISLLLVSLSLFSLNSVASANIDKSDPYKMIQKAANNAFKRFASEQSAIQKDPNILKTIVREELLPYVDYKYAAYKVIGSGNLRKTTRAQRDHFVIIFRDYLVTQYAQVFTRYKKQKVVFAPAKDFSHRKILAVKTTILDPVLGKIDIDFKVKRNKRTKEWKAFDLVAEGISLLDSKQAELDSIIRQKGIDYAAKLLKEKSHRNIVLKSSKKSKKLPVKAQTAVNN